MSQTPHAPTPDDPTEVHERPMSIQDVADRLATEEERERATGGDATGHTTPHAHPAAGEQHAWPTPERGPRVGTVVWGLVLALLGIAVVAVGLGVSVDVQVVLIGLLAIAGVALLVGTLVSTLRGR